MAIFYYIWFVSKAKSFLNGNTFHLGLFLGISLGWFLWGHTASATVHSKGKECDLWSIFCHLGIDLLMDPVGDEIEEDIPKDFLPPMLSSSETKSVRKWPPFDGNKNKNTSVYYLAVHGL